MQNLNWARSISNSLIQSIEISIGGMKIYQELHGNKPQSLLNIYDHPYTRYVMSLHFENFKFNIEDVYNTFANPLILIIDVNESL